MADQTGMVFEAIPISPAAGIQVSSTNPTASAATALPTMSDGTKPRYVRVQATAAGYIKFGGNAVAATVNDIAINANEHQCFKITGFGGFFSYLSDTGTSKCNVNSLEV